MNKAQPAPNLFLFYSKSYCEHSKRCIDRLMKSNMLNNMVLCNIDDPKLNIPPFISVVPALYNSTERRLYTANDLTTWIDTNSANTREGNNTMSMADITGDANIFGFQQNEMRGTGGGAYAFIDDNQNDALPSTFEFLDGSNKKNLVMPVLTRASDTSGGDPLKSQSAGDDKRAQQDELSKAYEKLLADRKMDMANSITNMRR
jgi:hypothetical protein